LNAKLASSLLQKKSHLLDAQLVYESADLKLTAETQLIKNDTGVVLEKFQKNTNECFSAKTKL
tara:strand:- start:191 stop:379 length:189 start_codon:yes stop_codon:yes gene_type:complete